ncbi:MAG: hypothetical protein NUW02_03425 [Candidatus Campbellbacteria bacterium]|nr:hypothetical protein [Candidatus Campbellbacteria bacterium]
MTALISTFGGSLFLLSLFFAFKEWEIKRSSTTTLTLFLQRHSPVVRDHFLHIRGRVVHFVVLVVQAVRDIVLYVFHTLLTWGRTIVVLVAAHMIRAARGEKLVAQGKVSSEYFKHLYDHKKKIQGGISQENPVE